MTAGAAIELARRALGEHGDWLQVSAARPPPEAITLAEFLADDGRRLDQLLATWHERNPDDPPEYRAGVIGSVARMAFAPLLALVGRERVLPGVDVSEMRFGFSEGHGAPDRVWWPNDVTVEPVADLEATLSLLIAGAIDFLTPLVHATRLRVPIGQRGLWGRVIDVFTGLGPGYDHPDPQTQCDDLSVFRRLVAGTVLDQPIEVVVIDRPDGVRCMVRTVACCFAYKKSPDDHGEREVRPWDDSEWSRHCMSCPLIPVEETVRRANYWIEDERAGEVDRTDTTATSPA